MEFSDPFKPAVGSAPGLRTSGCPAVPSGAYLSLIIRLWQEAGREPGNSPGSWCSEVEHIQSGRHYEFSTLAELEHFLRASLKQLEQSGLTEGGK